MENWPVEDRVFVYDGHLISRFGDVPWPLRFPDLSTCDFSLWGYLKSRVYTHKPRTLNDLKEAIRQEIRPIDRAKRMNVCCRITTLEDSSFKK
jgi:hypothetical protein